MTTTGIDFAARRTPPGPAEVSELHRLWRETPADLYGVRRRFVAWRTANGIGRESGAETVLRYRPADLPWPSRDDRIRNRWHPLFLMMDGPAKPYVRKAPRPKQKTTVVDKVKVCGLPPRRPLADVLADWQADRDGDPTPEQILAQCREIRRGRGEIVLLEIDLR